MLKLLEMCHKNKLSAGAMNILLGIATASNTDKIDEALNKSEKYLKFVLHVAMIVLLFFFVGFTVWQMAIVKVLQ